MSMFNCQSFALGDVDPAALDAAIAKLPERYRAAFSLVVVEGCSYKAASDALQIPVGVVMRYLAGTRRALAPLLSRNGHEQIPRTAPLQSTDHYLTKS